MAGSPKLASSEDFLSGDWKDIKAQEIRGIRSNMLFLIYFVSVTSMILSF